MSNPIQDFNDIEQRLETLRLQRGKLLGRREELGNRLKELGFETRKKAVTWLESTEVQIKKLRSRITKSLGALEDKVNKLEGGS